MRELVFQLQALRGRSAKKPGDACKQHLLTFFSHRSLAEEVRDYVGAYGGDQKLRVGAHHQSPVLS